MTSKGYIIFIPTIEVKDYGASMAPIIADVQKAGTKKIIKSKISKQIKRKKKNAKIR